MSLNIKNEETCELARELATLTGESMTGAITVALRERLERERHERSVESRVQELTVHSSTLCPPAERRPVRSRAW